MRCVALYCLASALRATVRVPAPDNRETVKRKTRIVITTRIEHRDRRTLNLLCAGASARFVDAAPISLTAVVCINFRHSVATNERTQRSTGSVSSIPLWRSGTHLLLLLLDLRELRLLVLVPRVGALRFGLLMRRCRAILPPPAKHTNESRSVRSVSLSLSLVRCYHFQLLVLVLSLPVCCAHNS